MRSIEAGSCSDISILRLSALDAFDPIEDIILHGDYHIFDSVWKEVEALRESGELLTKVQKVKCPIIAIHEVGDPHPIESVRACLAPLERFRLVSLAQCGHRPWIEAMLKIDSIELLLQSVGRKGK